MISLYIHVPFCKDRCRYCDFYSTTGARIEAYCVALEREFELHLRRGEPGDAGVATVYCGGGTPSLLSPGQWRRLTERVVGKLTLAPDVEWSIECNPDSFTEEKARAWLAAGVNRLTVGVQSLHDRCLRFLGRPHSAGQALELLANPLLGRFGSVGVDVMYGLPGQEVATVAETLETLLSMDTVHHLSAYELTIAPDTPLGRHRSRLPLPPEEVVIAMHETVGAVAARHGFEHYEISNYARPGHRCRHNIRYWTHEPYLGLGPSAHSFLPPERRANVADLERYIQDTDAGRLPVAHVERLGAEELSREVILLGLRTAAGIDEERYRRLTGRRFAEGMRRGVLERLSREGYLVFREGAWRPTPGGMLVADALTRELV
jgi:oxygen-independent coproporphyrinogen-3 oxidase